MSIDLIASSSEFEELLLSFLLHDKDARDLCKGTVTQEHFSTDVHKVCYTKMTGRSDMSPVIFKEELLRHVKASNLPAANIRAFIDKLDHLLLRPQEDDARYARENLNRFIKVQNVKRAFSKSGELFKEEKWEEIVRLMDAAVNSGLASEDLGVNYLDDLETRLTERRTRTRKDSVGIGVPDLDVHLGGGLTPGQIGLIVGGTGRGKSICLQSIARYNLLRNKNTVYVTLELSKELIADRMDVAEAGVPLHFLKENEQVVRNSVTALKAHCKGNLIIKEYAPKRVTPSQLQAFIRQIRQRGVAVDTLCLDYLDLMKAPVDRNNKYEEMDDTVVELIALAKEENLRIWTATQLNRAGIVAENPDASGIAGAINKLFNVDFAMFLAQNKDEATAQIMRLAIAKNRNGPTDVQVEIDTNYAFFRFFLEKVSELSESFEDHVA